MARKTDPWNESDEVEEISPLRKRKVNRALAEDLDPEESDEWGRERGTRGRKPAGKKHRRPRPAPDDEF